MEAAGTPAGTRRARLRRGPAAGSASSRKALGGTPCPPPAGHTVGCTSLPPGRSAGSLEGSLTESVSGRGGLWWDLSITQVDCLPAHPSSHLGLGPPGPPGFLLCHRGTRSPGSPHPGGTPEGHWGDQIPESGVWQSTSSPGTHTHVLHICVYVPACVTNSRVPHAVGAGGPRGSCLLRPRGHTTRRAQPPGKEALGRPAV